jgi:hypothetical protein
MSMMSRAGMFGSKTSRRLTKTSAKDARFNRMCLCKTAHLDSLIDAFSTVSRKSASPENAIVARRTIDRAITRR